MPISKPRSSLRLYVLIRVAAVSEPPLDHSGVTVFRRAYYSIWHEVVHSVGDRYSDYLRSAARSGVPPWVAAAEPTLARQTKSYRSRTGQNVFREELFVSIDRLRSRRARLPILIYTLASGT